MGMIIQRQPTPTKRYTRSIYSSSWDGAQEAIIDWGIERRVRVTPTTSQRQTPSDLFAGTTSRVVTTTLTNSGITNFMDSYIRYIGMPTSQATDWGNTTSVTVADPSREAMYNKIRGELRRDAVNLAMALAEYRQTAKLFSDLAGIVASRGRSLKAGWKNSKAKTIAKANLGFQYGVKPLASDMLGSIEELKNAAKLPVYIGGQIKRKAETRKVFTNRMIPWNGGSFPVRDEISNHKYFKTTWRAKMKTDTVFTSLAAHGFTNPFSLAYELVPYSFVIDWWVNIGEVLSSLDNLLLAHELLVADSKREIVRKETTLLSGKFQGNNSATQIVITDTRTSVSSISMIATLAYKPSVSKQHILNGLSLLALARR